MVWIVLLVAVVLARAIGGFLEEKQRREDERSLDELRRGAKPS